MVLFPGTKSPARGEKDAWACLGPDKSAGSLPQSGMAHQLIHRYHCLCFALLTMGSSLHIHPFLVWTHQLKQYNTEFMTAKNTICKYNDFRISGEGALALAWKSQGKNVYCAQGPFWQAGDNAMALDCFEPSYPTLFSLQCVWKVQSRGRVILSSICKQQGKHASTEPVAQAWGYHQGMQTEAPCYLVSRTHCGLIDGPGGGVAQ